MSLEGGEQRSPNSLVLEGRRHRERSNLAEILPKHVQGTTANHLAIAGDRNNELLDRLKEHDQVFAQQHTLLDKGGHQG